MTTKQSDFIRSLIKERDTKSLTPDQQLFLAQIWEGQHAGLTPAQASRVIDSLLALPKRAVVAPEAVDVPAGRYALVHPERGICEFFIVDRPEKGNWAGRTFVSQQASDDKYPVRGARRDDVMARIAADPQAAMIRYGHELGRCGRCGRTLTDEVSRAMGIGPDCADILGIPRLSEEEVVAFTKRDGLSVEEDAAWNQRDDVLTEALGIAPGETLVIDVPEDVAPSGSPKLGWREEKALIEQQQGGRKRRKDGPSSQNAPQPEGCDIFGAPL